MGCSAGEICCCSDVLDSSIVDGSAVKAYLESVNPEANVEVYPLVGPKGSTDMVKVRIGKLESPLKFVIQDGKIQSITGDKSELLDILLANDRNRTVAELGIGTNEAAILNGIILEDEKVYGTVHVAFGTNTSFGGVNKADCHMDGIILKPTLYLDDLLVIQDGKFMI